MKSKLRSFDEVMSALNSIDCINSGGCGISALAMYLWLEKNEQIIPTILFCYEGWSQDLYESNYYVLNNCEGETLSVPNHIMLVYKGKKVDSKGIMKYFKKNYKFHHEVDLKKLISTINGGGWNYEFNRENCVKIIENWLGFKLPIHSWCSLT